MDSAPPIAVTLVGDPSRANELRLGVLAALDQGIVVRDAIAGMSGADTAEDETHPWVATFKSWAGVPRVVSFSHDHPVRPARTADVGGRVGWDRCG